MTNYKFEQEARHRIASIATRYFSEFVGTMGRARLCESEQIRTQLPRNFLREPNNGSRRNGDVGEARHFSVQRRHNCASGSPVVQQPPSTKMPLRHAQLAISYRDLHRLRFDSVFFFSSRCNFLIVYMDIESLCLFRTANDSVEQSRPPFYPRVCVDCGRVTGNSAKLRFRKLRYSARWT